MDTNARLRSQAIALQGEVNYMNDAEAARLDAATSGNIDRPWELWKKSVL